MSFRTKQAIDFWLGNLLLLLLFLPVRGLGLLLRRRHTLDPRRGCVVIKLVGAGSLFMAVPSLQAIRGRFPPGRFFLIGTHAVSGFAKEFGWFDECWTVDDRNPWTLCVSSVRVIVKAAWRCDHLIDLEVHSRLTTVLSCLTTVRNRLGFVDEIVFWRRAFYTHMTFFNVQGPVYAFYDMLATWFGVSDVPVERVHAAFRDRVRATLLPDGLTLPPRYVAIGPGCSSFGKVRQLDAAEWRSLLKRLGVALPVVVLGGSEDRALCAAITTELGGDAPDLEGVARCRDLSGQLGIRQSAAVMAGAERFIGIDSLLLHLARALSVPSGSVWGPTDPRTRLRPGSGEDRIWFAAVPCAPCIHVHEAPPCGGARACIPAALRAAPQTLPAITEAAMGWVVGPDASVARPMEAGYV